VVHLFQRSSYLCPLLLFPALEWSPLSPAVARFSVESFAECDFRSFADPIWSESLESLNRTGTRDRADEGNPMKLRLFQQILEVNQSFDRLIVGLEKLESVPFFQRDLIQHARSDVEIARVYANREFFDNFEVIVENDAKWAYKFQRDFDQKLKDQDDSYLEVRDSEDRRKRKGLPPRVVILPNWDMSDEDRYDEQQTQRRKSAVARRRRSGQKLPRKAGSAGQASHRPPAPKRRGRRP
jgi:hypothetical protein